MVLDRSALLEELELKTERIPFGAGEVIVSEIGSADYLTLWTDPNLKSGDGLDMTKFRPALVARCVVDEEGNRLLSDEDAAVLARKSATKFNLLAKAAEHINGLSGDGIKNSEPSPSDSSSSDSP